ncbi:hypothetical protein [Parvibaculum sp.]|uniref:hypothetical protein n=1 Tax=Parvibaculum sp. TaxID=2024848 RepID=UPI001D3BB3FF|nr:hypothetical protein [Parvibaculum sp.]MBX3489795.1 hypothetical protein [Parvibaculum sp.]
MPRGYRLAIIALGLTLLAYQGHSQEAEKSALEGQPVAEERQSHSAPTSEKIPTPKQQDASSLVPAIQGIETAVRDLVAAQDQGKDVDEIQRQKDDLDAQEKMALWAMWMFVAAATSVLLTGAGILLLWKTLKATRDALTETVKATRAMIRQNELTEYAQRPWIVVDDISVGNDGDISVCFRNVGSSPARQFVKVAATATLPRPFPASPIPDFNFSNHTFLAPNATEFMFIDNPPRPRPDRDLLIRIRIAYTLPSGGRDEHFESFAMTVGGGVMKVTAEDFKTAHKKED